LKSRLTAAVAMPGQASSNSTWPDSRQDSFQSGLALQQIPAAAVRPSKFHRLNKEIGMAALLLAIADMK
jgi:hypothetical protein